LINNQVNPIKSKCLDFLFWYSRACELTLCEYANLISYFENMKFSCSHCSIYCKSISGLTRHIREKHNLPTQHQNSWLNNSLLKPSESASDFPVFLDFDDFGMVHELTSQSSLTTSYKRSWEDSSSLQELPDSLAKRARVR